MSNKEYIYVHEASKEQLLAELMQRQKVFVVFHNWVDDSSVRLFATEESCDIVFENLVRELLDPDLDADDTESRVAQALKDNYFEYSGDGTETIRPFVEIQELEIR